jgi:two-component system, OmpR family, response regulator
VLVVDDNDDAADLLSLMLEQAEYATNKACDGPSALAAVEAWTPDVVILDIGLPGMSGYDVARELRRSSSRERLELIALTGWGSLEDKQRAMDAGFDVHLTKPVDAEKLYGALAQLEQRAGTH